MTSIRFPDDLLSLQTAWLRTYDQLTQCSAAVGTTALRRRLIVLSGRIAAHTFWSAQGRSPATHVELRRQARARGWERAA